MPDKSSGPGFLTRTIIKFLLKGEIKRNAHLHKSKEEFAQFVEGVIADSKAKDPNFNEEYEKFFRGLANEIYVELFGK